MLFDDEDGSNQVKAGDAIELSVYQDANGNPADGVAWLASVQQTVQAVDGSAWSKYPLAAPLTLGGPGDVGIGVVRPTPARQPLR